MANNFYTKWVDGTTVFSLASMDIPLADIDKIIGYHHNPIVHADGDVLYDVETGILSWSGTIWIYFNNSTGKKVSNKILTSNVTLTDNQFAYCDLNETDDSSITMSAASITLNAASNTIANNRLVLGYRNTTSDDYFPVHLHLHYGQFQVQTTNATETTLASKYITADKAYQIEARVIAREGTVTEVATYIRRALIYRETGFGATIQGSVVDVWTLESSSATGWDCTLDVDSDYVRIRVTGVSGKTIEWKGEIKFIEI
jgi:hypothetical protein